MLVVDDDTSVAQTLAWLFQNSGYVAAMAHNGRDAIELAARMNIDVALVDIILPEGNGIETALAICQNKPGCKILLMSGDPEGVHLFESAKQRGAHFQLLAKPIPLPELLESVSGLLSEDSQTGCKLPRQEAS